MKDVKGEPVHPAWADAHTALKYINKGKARGCRAGLFVRGESQRRIGAIGKWAAKRSGLTICVGLAIMACLCLGIQKIHLDTTLDSLWTPDSGRLQSELTYVSKVSGLSTDTNEMLIQTPKESSHHSILNAKSLLEHLEVLQRALGVSVDLFDVNWSLKDLCYSANIQQLDEQYIEQIFEKVFPCIIITPLDCFWEGSKLLGPNVPIIIPGFSGPMKWTNLNPQELLRKAMMIVEPSVQSFPFEILDGFMKRAGIGSGYQEKYCLNPLDKDCPETAPNKGNTTPPDVASILAGGCYGFASRYMHWAPDLIIGGPVHNKSGYIVKAGGLMSTVQLMSSSELYEYGRDTWRLNHVEWSEAKAQEVLTSWQTRFAEEVSHLSMDEERSSHFNFYTFTAAGLDSVVESASQFSWYWAAARVIGVMITSLIVGALPSRKVENQRSYFVLILMGSAVGLLGMAAGCGVCGFLKIPFNVATVQVLPYLTLAVVSGVWNTILYSMVEHNRDAKSTLKHHGLSIIISVISLGICTGAGAWFPIPAVRSIAYQLSIMTGMSALAVLTIFPAICHIMLKKKYGVVNNNNNKPTPGSQCTDSTKDACATNSNNPHFASVHKNLSSHKLNKLNMIKNNTATSNNALNQLLNNEMDRVKSKVEFEDDKFDIDDDVEARTHYDCFQRSNSFTDVYSLFLGWNWFSPLVFVFYCGLVGFAVLGIFQLRLGLPITDVVPSNSSEWEFLSAQSELFPVYHVKAVTKANFDYPSNQKLLMKFHETMSGLPWVIRDDNGAVPNMWLAVFREWLEKLQATFDREWNKGFLNKEGWTKNASADGILAFKLSVQTGHIDHPVDMTQLPTNRLVDHDGNINPRAFYVYLTAWAWNDPLAYGATAANLKPEPRNWIHTPEDKELKIPKSAPIKYAEIAYIFRTTSDENDSDDKEQQILEFVREVRKITTTFEARGLPVFPSGIPFKFYEQYLTLPMNATVVVGVAFGLTALILFFSLGLSLRPVVVVTLVAGITLAQIAGAVGWLNVGLNALSIEIGLLGVSLMMFFTIQMVVAFCCIPGPARSRRVIAFKLVGPPAVQSLVLIACVALILYSPDFTFIFTHFTLLIALSAVIVLMNLTLLVPVLLSIFKPSSWLIGICADDPTYLSPLTPSPVAKRRSNNGRTSRSTSRNESRSSSKPQNQYSSGRSSSSRNYYGKKCRAPSENSLSTISEEPSSCATRRSADIVVQPQVVVQAFDGENSKTTVSAKLKVEVHSSILSNSHGQSSSINTSSNMSENSGTSSSTSSSGSLTSSASSACSYNDRDCNTPHSVESLRRSV